MDILKANKKEIPDIVLLNSFVQRIHAERHPDIFKPVGNDDDLPEFFDSIISKETNCILIAYIEGTPVGYLWATFYNRPDNPLTYERRQVYIHHVAVHEGFRRKHIGSALFEEIRSIAEQEGFHNFVADTLGFNKDAQTFFQNLGFDALSIRMWRNDESNT